jgi:quercetin dioxygenase-like cupin family protein
MKRVICGTNEHGRNVVLYEGPLRKFGIEDADLAASSEAAGEAMHIAWAAPGTRSATGANADTIPDFDLALKPGETRFIHVEIAPGAKSPMHRTPQINDYLVAIAGELTMFLEDGSSTRIQAGDMLVQLAGWHSWHNEGTVPFKMAGVVIGIETDVLVPYGVEMAEGAA